MNQTLKAIAQVTTVGVTLSFVAGGLPAEALTFNWSFNATRSFPSGTPLGIVSGRISGVQDNATTSSGLIATVLSTPDHQYEGLTFSSLKFGSITVANGIVTNDDLYFEGSDRSGGIFDFLFLGLVDDYPDYGVYNGVNLSYRLYNNTRPYIPPDGGTTFTSAVVPEPSSVLGLLALGTIGAGATLKRKLKTSKSAEKELEKIS